MKTETIEIAWNGDGTLNVVAERYGEFGIHRTPTNIRPDGCDTYTVTHVRTGYAAGWLLSRDEAITLARRYTAARLNWKFNKPERIPKRTLTRAKSIFREVRGRRD